MNVETFLNNFGHIANAPEGVKRLRELILQLAVTGNLVRRLSNDTDSQVLLTDIAVKRDRLIAAGEIKVNSPLPEVASSSQLPSVPKRWSWIRLGNLASKIGSGSTPRGGSKVYTSTGVPFLRSQNIWNDGIRLDDVVYIDSQMHEDMRNTHVLPNDILLNITGASLGRCACVPSKFPAANVSQHVTIIRPLIPATGHFVRICLLSPFGQEMIWGRQVGMAREGLSKKVLEQFEIPLPPLEEQKSIVAKVDELMMLCDRLEAQQRERQECFSILSRASHKRFVEQSTPANFNRLFYEIGVVSPEDFRKTIVWLAVSGRLVAPSEGEGVSDSIPSIINNAPPFAVPKGWRWTQFDKIAEIYGGYAFRSEDYSKTGVFILRVTNIEPHGRITQNEPVYIAKEKITKELERFYLTAGDILLVMVGGSLGKIGVVSEDVLPALLNQNLWRIKPASEEVYPPFLKLLTEFLVSFQRIITRSTHGHLSREEFRKKAVAIPPIREQRHIVAKVEQLFSLINKLERQFLEKARIAEALAKTAVTSFTGSNVQSEGNMKAPKTELVSNLKLNREPKDTELAPLASLLARNKKEMPAKALWQQSGLAIDAFYQQLKTELAHGWIQKPEPEEVIVRIVETA